MALESVSEILLPRLLAASVQSLLLVAIVWALCRAMPKLSAGVRAGLWWLVALQLVVGVFWSSPLALPLLPAEPAVQAVAIPLSTAASMAGADIVSMQATPPARMGMTWSWQFLAALAWVLGLAFMVARSLHGYLATRRLLRASEACRDRSLLHALQLAAEAHGLAHTPRLRLSADIDSPQLIGPWRPVLLLPRDHVQSMHGDELDMALTHELVHLQRRDLWWGLLPALARHVFFFNPLAHYAAREYEVAREAACDAAVIAGNRHCAHDYGRLLVRLGVAPRPSAGLASASPTFLVLKRRLLMLQNTASTPRFVALAIVGVIAVLGVIPYRIIAAPAEAVAPPAPTPAVRPVGAPAAAHATPTPAARRSAPTAAVAPVAKVAAAHAGDERGFVAPPPPPPPAPPAPPAPHAPHAVPVPAVPPPPPPPAPLTTRGSYSYVNDGDRAYVMLSGNETFAMGSSQDMRDAQRQRRGSEEILWMRKGKARYVVRDAATLRKLKSLHDEISAVGEQQGKLGEQQGRLGEQQGELGAQQAEIGAKMAAIAASRAADAATGDARRASARATAAQSERMAALEAQQRGMSEQMEFLAKRQADLGREQAALGATQSATSQRAAREANRVMEEAIKSGVAQPVNQ